MMYRYFLIFLILTQASLIRSQPEPVIDSLENLLATSLNDTTKLDILNELIFEYSLQDPDKAIELGTEAMNQCVKIGDKKRASDICNSLGIAYNLKGNYLRSIVYFLDALKGYEQIDNKKQAANTLNNIGITYDELGDYRKATSYYQESLSVYDEIEDPFARASILNNLGTAYEALEELDSAVYYYNESLILANQHKMLEKLADAYLNLGSISLKNNDPDAAIKLLDKAVNLDVKNNNRSGLVESYTNLAKAWLNKGNFPNTFQFLQKALQLSKELGMINRTSQVMKVYSDYYEKMGDPANSLKYLKEHISIHDSLFSVETRRQIENLSLQYETEKKEQEISSLTEKNQLQVTRLKLQRTKTRLFSIIAILGIIATGLLLINNRMKLKANQLLVKKTKLIELQNIMLEERSRKLKELDKEKDNFLSLVAHDLKSPLNKILGMTNLIKATGTLNDEQNEYILLMNRVTLDARRLIENLLDINLLESGKLMIQTEKFDLCDLMKELSIGFADAAKVKKITLHFDGPEELWVVSNRDFITRIADNLLSNAVKFSPNGKEITVGCIIENDTWFQISFADQGPGIKPEEKEKLFVKYQKLSAKPTGGESSTGLGLAIVKLLVDYLGGDIEVKSIEKTGSTFIVHLPIQTEDSKQETHIPNA